VAKVTDAVPLSDPTLERVSACPVHFLWDGRGRGRAFVRAGFLGFLLAALVGCVRPILHIEIAAVAAVVILAGAAVVWSVGQGISFVVVRRISSRAR
jgi:hypothetical protein